MLFIAAALAYATTGLGAVLLAIPPGYASPLYPAAGIALAVVIVFGRRMVPAVALGSFMVNLWLGRQHELTLPAVALPAIIASGAALQAWAGAALVKRFVPQPLLLSEPREIAVFFAVGAFTACLVSSVIATAALGAMGVVPPSDLLFTWVTWWMGDSLGVLIAAPIVLTLIGEPRADWAARRLTVGLTLGLVTALLSASILQVARWDEERTRTAFDREAANALSTLSFMLQQPLYALEALHGVYVASDTVSGDELRLAAQAWLLSSPMLYAVGYQERVSGAEIGALEGRARAEGFSGFQVVNRTAADAVVPFSGDEAMVIRYIEPLERNRRALGVNTLSVPAARAAIEAAVQSDRAAATTGFRLSQDPVGTAAKGVSVYRAIYKGSPKTASERQASLRGLVFATIRLEDVLRSVTEQLPQRLALCVVDIDSAPATRRLAGPAGCEASASGAAHSRTIAYASRQWSLRVTTRSGDLPATRDSNAWLFSIIGLMSAAVLGALLLTVTGRTRRIEAAVRERTAALQLEVREREQAEAAMRESEQRFRNIFNNVPIGVVYTDLRGNVLQTNPRFCELTGYTASELVGMPSLDFTHPDDVLQDADLSRQLVTGEIPMYRRNKRYIARDGRTLWVQSTVSLLRDEQGVPRRIVGAVEDITEHLQLAEAQQARAAAEASNHAKSDFLSRMSHELRTPLNAMLGFAQLLELDQRHPLAESQRPWVGQIQHAGWHLLEMINDVLDLSRIESGSLRLAPEPLALEPLITASLALVEPQARTQGVMLTRTRAAHPPVRVLADATRMKQILTNLLSNAVKYNRPGGEVRISTRCMEPAGGSGALLELDVSDSGQGMSAEQLAQLFQPFNRLGRERGAVDGTGIGLVIAKLLAERQGGALRVASAPGVGSTFTLVVPLTTEPQAPSVHAALEEIDSDYHRRQVLYIEDNEINVEVMRGILAQRPQVQLEVATTGLDGLARVRTAPPDLVLLDMNLPDIDGMALLEHLQADETTADIAVVVVSADALPEQIAAALAAGASRYLTKPVAIDEVLAVIDELLSKLTTRFG